MRLSFSFQNRRTAGLAHWPLLALAAVFALASCASREVRVTDETTLVWEAGVVEEAVRATDRYSGLLSAALNRQEAYASPAAAAREIDALAKAAEARKVALKKLQELNAMTQEEVAQMTACVARYNEADKTRGDKLHYPIGGTGSPAEREQRREQIKALGNLMSNLYVQIAKGMDEVDALKKAKFIYLDTGPDQQGRTWREVSFRFDS